MLVGVNVCCQVVLPAYNAQHGVSPRNKLSVMYHDISEKHLDRILKLGELEDEQELEAIQKDKVRFAPQWELPRTPRIFFVVLHAVHMCCAFLSFSKLFRSFFGAFSELC